MVTSISGGLIVVGIRSRTAPPLPASAMTESTARSTRVISRLRNAYSRRMRPSVTMDSPVLLGVVIRNKAVFTQRLEEAAMMETPAPRIPAMRMERACLRPLRTEPLATTVCSVPWTLPVSRVLARRVRGIRVTMETTAPDCLLGNQRMYFHAHDGEPMR